MSETTTAAPEIDLTRLTAKDMRGVLALSVLDGTARAGAMLDMLDRVVVGGLEAIPFTRTGEYLKALDTAIGEAFSPKS